MKTNMIIQYFKTHDNRPFYGYSLYNKNNESRKNKKIIIQEIKLVYSPDLTNYDYSEISQEEYESIVNKILNINIT